MEDIKRIWFIKKGMQKTQQHKEEDNWKDYPNFELRWKQSEKTWGYRQMFQSKYICINCNQVYNIMQTIIKI